MRIPTNEIDADKMGGHDYPLPGSYHFEVTDVDEEDAKTQKMQVTCEILAGTTKGQEGKTHREGFFLTGPAMSRILQFAVAVGFLTQEESVAGVKAGEDFDIDFTQAVGRQFCGRITAKKADNGKTYNNLDFDIWPVGDPKAKGIPLNKKKLDEAKSLPKANGKPAASDGSLGGGAADAMGELFD